MEEHGERQQHSGDEQQHPLPPFLNPHHDLFGGNDDDDDGDNDEHDLLREFVFGPFVFPRPLPEPESEDGAQEEEEGENSKNSTRSFIPLRRRHACLFP